MAATCLPAGPTTATTRDTDGHPSSLDLGLVGRAEGVSHGEVGSLARVSAGSEVFTRFSARQWLSTLHDEVGAAGLAAAAALPGLTAALDQHAAAVREATTGLEAAAVAGVVLLANYGHGVLNHAREHGWQPPDANNAAAWRNADWTSLRLTAVCTLAQNRPDTPPAHPAVMS